MTVARRQAKSQPAPSAELQLAPAPQPPSNHLIIAGTGRAGTSFLVRYLTELGLDTTLARNGDRSDWDMEANAGLENLLVSGEDLPYVVKSPWISEYIDQVLNETRFKVDAFIVPVRDLVEAATSRVVLEQRSIHEHNPWMADRLDKTWETYGHTPGGLVYSLNPLDQARLLAVQFHRLVLKASEAGVPIVFPVFPRIATDWEYLHRCLRPILPETCGRRGPRRPRQRRGCGEGSGHERNLQGPANQRHLPEGAEVRAALPEPDRIDNIALRREISRLRQELKQQLSAQDLSAQKAADRNSGTDVHYGRQTALPPRRRGRYFVTRKGEPVVAGLSTVRPRGAERNSISRMS